MEIRVVPLVPGAVGAAAQLRMTAEPHRAGLALRTAPVRSDASMTEMRRARPTIRCLVEDLGIELPDLATDLGDLDDPWLVELRRIAPTSPTGQKRVLAIDHPLVYRLRVSSERGATWVDDEEGFVWLCAVRRRADGSDDDAYEWFEELHWEGRLLPTDDDQLRDQAEEAVRLFRQLRGAVFELVDGARDDVGTEHDRDLDGWRPARVLVYRSKGVEEIWCAISVRAVDGNFIRPELRDLLFAALEEHLAPAVFEPRSDWPTGDVGWFEAVRLGMR